jgi:signal transduction histidine kinase
MPNISHIRRNILLLLSSAIVAVFLLFILITPSVIHFSPQVAQEERSNFYLFTPILALLLLTNAYVYLQPINEIGRHLRQGQLPPSELAQRARARAFSAPFHFFFVPVSLVVLIVVLADLYGLVAIPGYNLTIHLSYSLLIIVIAAAFALIISSFSRRMLQPVLLATAGLASDRGRRYEIRTRLAIILLSFSFITFYLLGVFAFSQVYETARENTADHFRQWGRDVAQAALYLDDQALLALITQADILAEYQATPVLSDPDGRYVIPPRPSTLPPPAVASELLEKDGRFALTLPIEREDGVWQLGVTYTFAPENAPGVRHALFNMLLLGAATLGLTLVTIYYLSDDITRDLKHVTTHLLDVARRGHVSERMYPLSLDEVGDLIVALDQVREAMAQQQLELNRRMEQMRQLQKASLALTSSVDFDQILSHICQVVQDTTASDNVTLYLYEVEQDTFTRASQVGHGAFADLTRQVRSQGMTRTVFNERRPILVSEAHDHPLVHPQVIEHGLRSIIAVPVISRAQSMGVLYVSSRRPNAYDDQDLQIVSMLAGQAAAAIENAHLLKETMTNAWDLERRARNLLMINRISRDLTSLLDPYEIFKATARHMVELMEVDRCSVLAFEQGALEGTIVAEYPETGATGRRVSLGDNPAIAQVLSTQSPLAVSDVQQDPLMAPIREQLAEVGVRAVLIVPLVTQDQIIGAISLDVLHKPHEFSNTDLELCRTVAAQAAIAASTARLLYDLQQQRRALTRKSQELAEESSKLDTILTSVPDGLVVTDLAGRIELSNPSFRTLAGLPPYQSLRGHLLDETFSLSSLRGAIADTLVHPDQVTTTDLELPDGRVFKASAAILRMKQVADPTQPSQIRGVVTVLRDITHEVEVDRMKTDFISTISHELRTPLTSILGFSSLIQREFRRRVAPLVTDNAKACRASDRILANLGIIEAESQRLTRLINDVLDIAKMESGRTEWHMTDVDMARAIHDSINATAALAHEQNLTVNAAIPSPLPPVWGDPDRMIQVLTNLLSNAIKFTTRGGITVSSWVLNADTPPPPQAPAGLELPSLVVGVTDTGSGIAQKDLPLVFERFRQVGDTLTEKPKGTGLGLPICKEIIEHHGGEIWVESKLDVGSTFYFTLPLSARPASASEDHPSAPETTLAAGESPPRRAAVTRPVLVVDDEPHIRQLLRQELNEVGYQVIEAADGDAALNQARHVRPSLIILDLFMPTVSGFAVIGALRADPETAHIPVVVLSVATEEAPRVLDLGAKACLAKPVNVEQLLDTIEQLVT